MFRQISASDSITTWSRYTCSVQCAACIQCNSPGVLQIAYGRLSVTSNLTWKSSADDSTADQQAGSAKEVHVLVFGEGEGKANPEEIKTIKVAKAVLTQHHHAVML